MAISSVYLGGGFFIGMSSKRKTNQLPADIIRESLVIDRESPTGLRWLKRPRNHFSTERVFKIWNSRFSQQVAGSETGGNQNNSYWSIRINGRSYRLHRIVYFLANGTDPGNLFIDHLDHNGRNNSPENLRLATNAENLRNRDKNKSNTSGYCGVSWEKRERKWVARITVDCRSLVLGRFDDIVDAIAARKAGESKYFGEYSYDASKEIIERAAKLLLEK